MAEWSVHIEADGLTGCGEAEAETLLEALAAHAPAVSYGAVGIAIRLSVEADTARDAVDAALEIFAGSCPDLDIFRVEAQTVESLNHELGVGDIPELVGVAELAELLKVSKQRASELARMPSFPAPVAVLASGPVWPTGRVLRYVRAWKRRPGRPHRVRGRPPRSAPRHVAHEERG